MSPTAAATIRTSHVRFTGFLAAAVVLHGLLLLLPAKRGLQPEEVLNRLSVSLQAVATRRPVADPPPDQADLSPPAVPVAPAAASFPPLPERLTPPAARESIPLAPAEPSTARLLDHAYRMRWRTPEDGATRRLGEPLANPGSGLPLPGLSGRLTETASTVAGIEIVDRWLAADGSHNVLIRTPSGNMLCGRAEAWDPMRPLVEHVTMFRVCGAGEPTFEWPDRYRTGAERPREIGVEP